MLTHFLRIQNQGSKVHLGWLYYSYRHPNFFYQIEVNSYLQAKGMGPPEHTRLIYIYIYIPSIHQSAADGTGHGTSP